MTNCKTKKIYIILTHTGTVLSRIIRGYTGADYSHVSISLDKELTKMYSFGRLNPYNPFIGGFVHEGIDFGTFKRFYKTEAEVYSMELTDWQYKKIKRMIKKIQKNKEAYKFNIIGLFAVGLNIRIERKNYFYCAEFVKYLVENADLECELPNVIHPIDFKDLDEIELEYKGLLREYKIA